MNKLSELIETITQAKAEVARLLADADPGINEQIDLSVVENLLSAANRVLHEKHVQLAALYPDPVDYKVHILWGDEESQEDQGDPDVYTFDTHEQYTWFMEGVEAAKPDEYTVVYDSTHEGEEKGDVDPFDWLPGEREG